MLCFGTLSSKALKIVAKLFPLLFSLEYHETHCPHISSSYIISNSPNLVQFHKNNDNKNTELRVPTLCHLFYRHY